MVSPMTRIVNIIENKNAPEPRLLIFQDKNWKEIEQSLLNRCSARNHEAIH